MRNAELKPVQGGLAFVSDYDPVLVARLKATVPASARRWDAANKRWIIAPEYGQRVAEIVSIVLGISIQVPCVADSAQPEARLLKLEYLGAAKDRGRDERMAFGYVNGGWSAIFPESVLRRWFGEDSDPRSATTLYATLGLSRGAQADEIKAAYRRLARQWHPDVCKEPGAAEQFMAIKKAYDILGEPSLRARYDAGLAMQMGVASANQYRNDTLPYRAPLRCGYVLATGAESVGRFVVSEILQWEDIIDSSGRVMVTSWPAGADMFETRWV